MEDGKKKKIVVQLLLQVKVTKKERETIVLYCILSIF